MAKGTQRLKDIVKEAIGEAVREGEEEELRSKDLPPGTILDRGEPTMRKVPWTRRAMEATYPMVEFTPEETVPVTVSSISYQLIADTPIKVPSIIKDVYDSYRKNKRSQGRFIVTDHGIVNVALGAGGLTAEPVVERK